MEEKKADFIEKWEEYRKGVQEDIEKRVAEQAKPAYPHLKHV